MTGEFELELSKGKEFKDKMGAKRPGHSPLTLQENGTFTWEPSHVTQVASLSIIHHVHAACRRSVANPDWKACDRPEPLLSSQLLRLENLVLSFFFSPLQLYCI